MNTLIIVIMDESGSMESKKMDVIGGFNSFIDDQKKIQNDKARLYLIKFNTQVTTIHKGIYKIKSIKIICFCYFQRYSARKFVSIHR